VGCCKRHHQGCFRTPKHGRAVRIARGCLDAVFREGIPQIRETNVPEAHITAAVAAVLAQVDQNVARFYI
jgi:hypothetical protein